MTSDEIDRLIRSAAEADDRSVPRDLMERVLADAQRLQPTSPPAPAPNQARAGFGGISRLLDELGGWLGPVAIAASLIAGIGLGVTDPTNWSNLPGAGGLQSALTPVDEASDSLEALGLGSFDISSVEW